LAPAAPGCRGDRQQLRIAGNAHCQTAVQRRCRHTLALAEAPEVLRQRFDRQAHSITFK